MIGRVDMLTPRQDISHWKAKRLDLSNLLYQPAILEGQARHIEKATALDSYGVG